MKNFIYLFIFIAFIACNSSNNDLDKTNTASEITGEEYSYEEIQGTNVQRVKRFDTKNKIIEEGFVIDGIKTGEWVTYRKEKNYVYTITPYINGKLNGNFFEFDKRGYLVSQASFINDELDGKVIKYKYGKPIELSDFKNGKLHGKKIVNSKKGNKQEEVDYKEGVLDGFMRYFNDEGVLIMEYEYKNGKKIGGGKVNENIDNTPR